MTGVRNWAMESEAENRRKNENIIQQRNNWFSIRLTTTRIPMRLNFSKPYLCLIDIDFVFNSLSLSSPLSIPPLFKQRSFFSVVSTDPFGTDIFAPSKMACDNWKSNASAATVAARNASQISLRPSNAGAVSQNSSRFDRSWPSVNGTSDFQRIVSWHSGWFLRGGPPLPPINVPKTDFIINLYVIFISWTYTHIYMGNTRHILSISSRWRQWRPWRWQRRWIRGAKIMIDGWKASSLKYWLNSISIYFDFVENSFGSTCEWLSERARSYIYACLFIYSWHFRLNWLRKLAVTISYLS